MFKIIEDSTDRFEFIFDNDNDPLELEPVASTDEFIDLGTGGE